MKIVFCGGHHNTALIVAKQFVEKGNEVVWFGHKHSMIDDRNLSAEFKEVSENNIEFIDIKAGKFQPKHNFLKYFIRIPVGFYQSYKLLRKVNPDLVFSFGGYLALPVSFCAKLLKIPVVTHEQTVVSGLANKLISIIADKIFVSFESSLKEFPSSKTIFSGMPVRKEILKISKLLFKNKKKTIYFTGGKQGSHIINKFVFENLNYLIKKFNIIHQCGSNSIYNDYEKACELKNNLAEFKEDYLIKEYFFNDEIGSVYGSADFVISRSGAHTIYELLYLEKPSILIPIPWSHKNEQLLNAKLVEELGLGKVIEEKDLEDKNLLETIEDFSNNLANFKFKKSFVLPENPEKIIIEEINKLISYKLQANS